MKKITRVICLVLSLMLFVNLGSFEVLATDAEGQQDKVEAADQAQSQEPSSKTETDITADTEAESPKENEDSVKDGSETEQPEVPEEPLPEEIPDADDAGDTDAEAPSEPVTESGAKEDKTAEEEQPKEEEPSVDVQAAETQTIGGTVEGITAEPADESGKQLKITWTRVADAVKYQVQLLKYADGTMVSTSDTTDTSLQADVVQGEKYYIEIHAYKEDETGETEIAAGKIPSKFYRGNSILPFCHIGTVCSAQNRCTMGAGLTYRIHAVMVNPSRTSRSINNITAAKSYIIPGFSRVL